MTRTAITPFHVTNWCDDSWWNENFNLTCSGEGAAMNSHRYDLYDLRLWKGQSCKQHRATRQFLDELPTGWNSHCRCWEWNIFLTVNSGTSLIWPHCVRLFSQKTLQLRELCYVTCCSKSWGHFTLYCCTWSFLKLKVRMSRVLLRNVYLWWNLPWSSSKSSSGSASYNFCLYLSGFLYLIFFQPRKLLHPHQPLTMSHGGSSTLFEQR